ncbi:hypothetical protein CC85DRAFT_288968, partial [Cutaneotrichosporon oleaginosum]
MRPPVLRSLSLPLHPRPTRPLSRPLAPTAPRGVANSAPLLSKDKPNPDAPVKDEGPVDPAARGVNEMRRQWGGLIDGAEADLADEAAASRGRTKEKGEKEKKSKIDVDLTQHEGLEADIEPTVDPAARGVNEMRRQWGDLIEKKC